MNFWRSPQRLLKKIQMQKAFRFKSNSLKSFASLFLLGAFLSLTISACGGNANNSASGGDSTANPGASPVAEKSGDAQITLVSFAVTKAAHEAIIPKFVEQWKKEHNQNVTFKTSYGGSGSQTRAVIDGLEADIVHLALALDTQKIEKAGLIQPGWEKEVPNDAIVSKSVAALVTRPDNPKGIKTWSDLAKDGVKLITSQV
jgi:sulfate/thiosulfate transport system substrate-binding protein